MVVYVVDCVVDCVNCVMDCVMVCVVVCVVVAQARTTRGVTRRRGWGTATSAATRPTARTATSAHARAVMPIHPNTTLVYIAVCTSLVGHYVGRVTSIWVTDFARGILRFAVFL